MALEKKMDGLDLSYLDFDFNIGSRIAWCRKTVRKCEYCEREKLSVFVEMQVEKLTVEDYQELLDQAFTRSGHLCYKAVPSQTCCPYYIIKCDALEFAITKSQKKVIKKFNKFLENGPKKKLHRSDDQLASHVTNATTILTDRSATGASEVKVAVCPHRKNQRKSKLLRLERKMQKLQLQGLEPETCMPKVVNKTKTLEDLLDNVPQITTCNFRMELIRPGSNDEWYQLEKMEYELYLKYKSVIHKENQDYDDLGCFVHSFVKSPLVPKGLPGKPNNDIGFGSYHQLYWFDDKLIAVNIIDILPKCVCSLYFFYDPNYKSLSLGTYSLLRDVHLIRQLHQDVPSIQYYFTGFYIPSIQKMCYKKQLIPSYLLSPGSNVWIPFEECLPEISNNQNIECLVDSNSTDNKKDLVN